MAIVGEGLVLTDFTQACVAILERNDQLVEHVPIRP